MGKLFLARLKYDPVNPLIRCADTAVSMFAAHDLLGRRINVRGLMKLPTPLKIIGKQQGNGSWEYPGANLKNRTRDNFNQLETYRNLGILVEQFGFNRKHPAIQKAAGYLFSFQTNAGDFRGIYGNQYSPNYSAGIMELLVKAGYGNDRRIKKAFRWLLSVRQHDGGWAIPFRTKGYGVKVIYTRMKVIEPDATKEFSGMITGVVLRAFAAHPVYKKHKAVFHAGRLLLSSLFAKDNYPDRAGKASWERFNFPFWYTDLISALDTFSRIGFSPGEPQIEKGLNWIAARQQPNGLWSLRILKGRNKSSLQFYLALAICRIFKRYASENGGGPKRTG